jgi:heme exporter protein B
MTSGARIVELIKKDVKAEFRNLSSTASVFLFAITIVFIAVKSLPEWDALLFGAILWILILFSAIYATSKTFDSEAGNQKLFYYTLYHPVELVISKIIYNCVFIFIIFSLCYLLLQFFLDLQIKFSTIYLLAAFLSSLALSIINSFSTLIANSTSTNNSNLLLSILALPLAIPILLTMIKITKNINSAGEKIPLNDDLLILAGINLLLFGVVLLLIRQLWTA